ncbi:hypothetical protein GA0074692_3640 [Micromonospora pallida]|uniref:YcxB-like protein n=1 Tax=Micromonospora pallida TaxID=145854 RepID=A0A1C6SWL3_9ACTN|nr:YcxB family protein [Micromonospora pallida]SCL33712.1 hypothetical protein GA0074692_3640 [Micromonospora pallida]
MIISFETQPDRQRLTAAVRRVYRWALLPYWFCVPVLGLLAGLLLFTGGRWAWACLAGAVVCAVVPWLVVRLGVRASWKLHGIPMTWTFSEDGIHSANALTEGTIRWEALKDVVQIPDQILLRINWQQVIPVSIAGLTATQRDELFDLLRGRGLLSSAD